MNDGRDRSAWSKLEALLSECLAVPPPERAAIIARHRLSAKERDELQALLISAEQDTGAVLGGARLTVTERGEALEAGDRVGPYELIERIGAGGMGDVWRARLSDGTVKRDVALKLPRIALLDPSYQRRLVRESELLAQLAHPHITRLYDAGISEDDRPYMALELIDGQPIDQYCNARRVSLSARLRLFLQILDAVQYAHAHLIVHRDLKPSNMLVTADGQVKLLDFGIAKLLDPLHGDEQDITRVHGHPLTPEYAAPEHFERRPITVAADLFSLGVLLFELLAGQRPFGTERARGLRLVPRQDDAAPASSAIAADPPARMGLKAISRRRRLLQGDLDAVVAMPLRIAPEERYSDAEAFAADIRAFLDKRPIRAVRESAWSRGRKFIQRNPLAVAMGTVAFAAVVGGLIGVYWQAQRALAAAERAEQAAQESAAVTRFLTHDLLSAADPTIGGNPEASILSLVDRAAEELDSTMQDLPATTAVLHRTLGGVYGSLGRHVAAQEEFRRALDDYARQPGSVPAAERVRTLVLMSRSAVLTTNVDSGAAAMLAEAREAMPSDWSADHPLRLWAAAIEGRDLYLRGEYQASVAALEPVFLQRESYQDQDPDLLRQAGEWLAISYSNSAQPAAALATVNTLRSWLSTHFGAAHPYTLLADRLYPPVLREAGEYRAAIAAFQDMLPRLRAMLGPDHEGTRTAEFELGRTYMIDGRYEDANPLLQAARDHFLGRYGPEHEMSLFSANVLAISLERSGQTAASAPLHHEVARITAKVYGASHPNTLVFRGNSARAYLYNTPPDPERAFREIAAALRDSDGVLDTQGHQRAYLLRAAGVIQEARGEYDSAIRYLQQAVEIFDVALGPNTGQAKRTLAILERVRRKLP